MPRKYVKRSKKGMKGKKQYKSRPRRARIGVPEKASLTEILPTTTHTTNQNYSSYNLSLASCTRARDVAKGYQFYRIKSVKFIVRPLQDTFVEAGTTVPYLYYMIDRTRQLQAGFTANQLKSLGAVPRRMDDKNIVFHYKPSVLTDTYDNTAGAATFIQYKMSPWLPTRDINLLAWVPSTTDHQGIVWRAETNSGNAIAYVIDREVEIEFKKPSTVVTAADPVDVPLEVDPSESV